MENEEIYRKAKKKVKAKKGFFYHFIAYVFVLAMLYFIIKVANNGPIIPVVIVALSWGIGIATHYLKAFGTEQLGFLGINPDWEEDELEYEIEKLTRKRELRERLHREQDLADEVDELDHLELREMQMNTIRKDFRDA